MRYRTVTNPRPLKNHTTQVFTQAPSVNGMTQSAGSILLEVGLNSHTVSIREIIYHAAKRTERATVVKVYELSSKCARL